MLTVISATPSPYARKVRIALIEKGIPFDLVTDVPWNDDTVVGRFNPLEKLSILVTGDDGQIYDSSLILDYIEMMWPEPPLLPAEPKLRFAAKTIEVLQNGICDSVVLTFFERARPAPAQSAEWLARQRRKIERGVAELERLLGDNVLYRRPLHAGRHRGRLGARLHLAAAGGFRLAAAPSRAGALVRRDLGARLLPQHDSRRPEDRHQRDLTSPFCLPARA